MKEPRVFVIDDDVSIRDSLHNLFRSIGLAVETFSTAEEFLAITRSDVSGCVVLDVRMPGLSGLDLQKRLIAEHWNLPIIFVTAHGDIAMSVRAVKNGAVEFLTKPFRDQDLIEAVQRAVQLSKEQQEQIAEIAERRMRYESLTERERDVLRLVTQGLANKEIADELTISEPTVKAHRGRMMQKMHANSLADLIRWTMLDNWSK